MVSVTSTQLMARTGHAAIAARTPAARAASGDSSQLAMSSTTSKPAGSEIDTQHLSLDGRSTRKRRADHHAP